MSETRGPSAATASDRSGGPAPVEERWTAATVHGRCLLERPEDAGPGAPLLVAFHGYGETAREPLAALGRIPGSEAWLRASVEALHPFYKKTGEVVRSWMTKDDRERAIADNVRYVRATLESLRDEVGASGPLVVVGFSQGVAMTYRAAAYCGLPVAGIVALAGDVPPDVAADPAVRLPAVLVGRGTGDTWYSAAKLEADLAVLGEKATRVESCVFAGGHEWGEGFLAVAGRFLAGLSAASVRQAPG